MIKSDFFKFSFDPTYIIIILFNTRPYWFVLVYAYTFIGYFIVKGTLYSIKA